jgi:hypothetical protein
MWGGRGSGHEGRRQALVDEALPDACDGGDADLDRRGGLSALYRMRAWASLRAGAVPDEMSCLSSLRSAGVSVTRKRFVLIPQACHRLTITAKIAVMDH